MIGNPINSNFRIYFHKSFIYPQVKEVFKPYFDRLNHFLFSDMTEYLNSTITKVVWPGISDDAVFTQFSGTKDGSYRKRSNKSSKTPDEAIDKSLDIYFSVKESYYNWLLLYCNTIEHLKHINSGNKVHLPGDIFMHVLDDNGSILMMIVFSKVTFKDLEKMEFNVQDTNINNKEIQLSLTYTDFEIKFYTDNHLEEKPIIV